MSRCLMVGMGSIGTRHKNNLVAMGHEVLCVDPNVHCYDGLSLDDALDMQPEYAFICSPPALHGRHAKRAIERSIKHVFIEKPLTLDAEEAEEVVGFAASKHVTLAVGFMLRARHVCRQAKADIEAGRFGTIHAAHFECCWQPKPTSYAWPGVIQETCHELDLAQWLFGLARYGPGDMVAITADPGKRVAQLLGLFGKVRCSFYFDTLSPHYYRTLHIYGDKESSVYFLDGTEEQWDRAYRDEVAAFLKGEPLCTGAEALEVVKLCEAMG